MRIRIPRAARGVSHRATGSAKGNGNPYGIAAINAVFLLPLVFLRLFAPPQYLGGVLLLGVSNFFTLALVSLLTVILGYLCARYWILVGRWSSRYRW